MRILVVTQDFPPLTGGIQSYMGSICQNLHPLCERLCVVAPGSSSEVATDSGRPFPVRRIRIHTSWLALPLLSQLPEIVRMERATHVLYAQWFPALAGIRLPREVKQISIAHGRELLKNPLGRLGLALSGSVLRRMDAVIPNSRATANLLPRGIRPERIHVVHPGVDCSALRPPTRSDMERFRSRQGLSPNTPVVTTLARLVARKGIDTLIESVGILRARMPEAKLLVGGSGPDMPRLAEMVRRSGLTESVKFVGRIPTEDMSSFFGVGVFALLSRQTATDVEGFGMVLAEAQACNAPVLAARSGGMPEAVGADAGIIVEPDSAFQAAKALETLLSDPQLRTRMGVQGRKFAESLSWESRAEKFAAILRSVT